MIHQQLSWDSWALFLHSDLSIAHINWNFSGVLPHKFSDVPTNVLEADTKGQIWRFVHQACHLGSSQSFSISISLTEEIRTDHRFVQTDVVHVLFPRVYRDGVISTGDDPISGDTKSLRPHHVRSGMLGHPSTATFLYSQSVFPYIQNGIETQS